MLKLLFIASLWSLSFGSYSVEQPKVIEDTAIKITVHRSPTCQCCSKWITHLKKHHFQVNDILTQDMQSIKNKYSVPQKMASCHTAIVNGYVIEGHVPAVDIKALLKLKPTIIGISVPGMPVGTPGMEMGTQADAYNVVGFDKNNEVQIFNHYQEKE
jgi:hypothetical protein